MYNIMKAQKYQLIRDNVTYYIMLAGVIIVWIVAIMITEEGMPLDHLKGCGTITDAGLNFYSVFLVLIFTARICGDDIKDKTINYEILSGGKKSAIYFGRLFTSIIMGVIVYLLYCVLPVILMTAVFGWGEALPVREGVIRLAMGFVPVLRFIIMFAVITFLTRSSLGSVALGFILILGESLIEMMIQEDFLPISINKAAPFMASASMDVISTYNYKMDYINGKDVQVLKDMMPVGTIAMIVGSALVMCIIVSAAGYAVFSKKDMD